MPVSEAGLLRFTCVWEGDCAVFSPRTWVGFVTRVSGIALRGRSTEAAGLVSNAEPATQAGLRPPLPEVTGKVADFIPLERLGGVCRYSLLISAPYAVSRKQCDDWTRALEDEVNAAFSGDGSRAASRGNDATGTVEEARSNNRASNRFSVAVTVGEMAKSGPALVVMDADSTLFAGEGIDLVAAQAGVQQQVTAITAAAMRGELDFTASLRARMGTLAGLSVDTLEAVREVYDFSLGASQMIAAFRRNGTRLGVVSGGFVELVEEKARAAGVDYVLANRFEVAGGVLTGRPLGEIVTADSKEQALVEWATQLGVSPERCVAMGDGANDRKMVTRAGLGIAYCAKPALADVADARLPFPNLAAAAALLLPA